MLWRLGLLLGLCLVLARCEEDEVIKCTGGECVKLHLCPNGELNTDGANIIDIRFNPDNECEDYLLKCCPYPEDDEDIVVPPPPTNPGTDPATVPGTNVGPGTGTGPAPTTVPGTGTGTGTGPVPPNQGTGPAQPIPGGTGQLGTGNKPTGTGAGIGGGDGGKPHGHGQGQGHGHGYGGCRGDSSCSKPSSSSESDEQAVLVGKDQIPSGGSATSANQVKEPGQIPQVQGGGPPVAGSGAPGSGASGTNQSAGGAGKPTTGGAAKPPAGAGTSSSEAGSGQHAAGPGGLLEEVQLKSLANKVELELLMLPEVLKSPVSKVLEELEVLEPLANSLFNKVLEPLANSLFNKVLALREVLHLKNPVNKALEVLEPVVNSLFNRVLVELEVLESVVNNLFKVLKNPVNKALEELVVREALLPVFPLKNLVSKVLEERLAVHRLSGVTGLNAPSGTGKDSTPGKQQGGAGQSHPGVGGGQQHGIGGGYNSGVKGQPDKIGAGTQNPLDKTVDVPHKCGLRNVDGVGFRITGDNDGESEYGEFPWMVAILKEEKALDQVINLYQCGGSLIHPAVVLTAAHCVQNRKPEEVKVRLGEWDTQTKNEMFDYQVSYNLKRTVVLDCKIISPHHF
uniref:Peptidase S1 domain-containing protein n=1 Tax=Anopheles maculatus TaxID=74869 RepID=A0A182TBK1_9DIPT